MLYFAYGSNMLFSQMIDRVGDCEILGVGRLDGYSLAFNKLGVDGSGKCNIIPRSSEVVYGVVFSVDEEQLRRLDRNEGVPTHYEREDVEVWLGEEKKTCVTYVARRVGEGLRPTEEYLGKVVRGAQEIGLPEEYIEEIKRAGSLT